MLHLAVCSFLEPQPVGTDFPTDAIPLHATLLGNFEVDRDLEAVVEALESSAPALPIEAVTAEPAQFGFDGAVRVTLVTPTDALLRAHEALLDAILRLAATVDEPAYTGPGFRPHVTWLGGDPVESHRPLLLEALSLIDLRPDGNDRLRRVVATIAP